MNKKRVVSCLIVTSLAMTLVVQPKPIQAIDFSKDEAKYMSLCSSGKLTSGNKSTCTEFNKYLQQKNKDLSKQLESQKQDEKAAAASLETAQKQLDQINNEITSTQNEIQYVETTITNTQNEINESSQEIKDRMYAMQTYMHEDIYVNYIFGAQDFTDMLSRMDSFNQLTSNDKDLINELLEKKKIIEEQKKTLETAKIVLETKKKEQAVIQKQYETLFEEKKKQVLATQNALYDYGSATATLSAQIDKFNAEAYETKPSAAKPVPPSAAPSQPAPTQKPSTGSSGSSSQSGSQSSSGSSSSSSQSGGQSSSESSSSSSQSGGQSSSSSGSSSSSSSSTTSSTLGYNIYREAYKKLGCRYWWGANGPTYFDCSGLVWWSLNHAGVKVGRTTAAGYSRMYSGVSWSNSKTGDLACFGTSSVTHIGIVMLNSDGSRSLIHCGGGGSNTFGDNPNACVKISSFQPGSYYYNRIITIRRVG